MLSITGLVVWTETFGKQYFGSTIVQYLTFFIILLGSVVAGPLLTNFLEKYVKKLTKKTKTKLDDIILRAVRKPLPILVFAIGIRFGLGVLSLTGTVRGIADVAFKAFFILFLAYFTLRLIERLTKDYFLPRAEKTDTQLDDQLIPLLSKTLKIFVVVVAALAGMSSFGINVSSLVAGLGIGGLAIALAAKDTLSNIFGSFTIIADRPFRVNDRIRIRDYEGFVVSIGLRSTIIRTSDGRAITMPNNLVVNRSVINYHTHTNRRIKEIMGLRYDTSVKKLRKAMELLEKILGSTEGVKPGFQVHFTEFGDFAINLELRYFTNSNKNRGLRKVRQKVNLRIMEEFDKAKIEFSLPTQTIVLEEKNKLL